MKQLKEEYNFYKSLFDTLFEGVYFVDMDRRITYWNTGAERLTGFKFSEVMGKRCCDDVPIHTNIKAVKPTEKFCPIFETIKEGRFYEDELHLLHKDGHRIPVLMRSNPVRDSRGRIVGAVEVFSDNSPKVAASQRIEELQRLVLLDPLTSLGNRRFIEMSIRSKLNEMERYGWSFGTLFIDIDQFKRINDAYGHNVGDRVLKMVAKTLLKNTRPFDLIGRWGGEEFVAIIVNVDENQLNLIANKLPMLVEQSNLSIGSKEINVSISVGATLALLSDNVDSLIKRADTLMYKQKASKKVLKRQKRYCNDFCR